MPIGATIGAAAIGAGTSILGAHSQSSAIDHATDAQTAAYQQAIALQEKQYNQQRQDYAPWRAVGLGALSQLAQTENINLPPSFFQGQMDSAVSTANGQGGISVTNPTGAPFPPNNSGVVGAVTGAVAGAHPPTTSETEPPATTPPTTPPATTPSATSPPTTPPATTPNNPGAANTGGQFGAFYASPDYQFRVDQGTRAITGNKAAAGLLDAGSTGQGLINYGQAAGAQEFGNWYNRIASLAGVGQTATDATTAAGASATNAMTGLIGQQGNNLASSYLNKGQVSAGLIGNLGGIAGGLLGNAAGASGGGGGGMAGLFGSVI